MLKTSIMSPHNLLYLRVGKPNELADLYMKIKKMK